MKKVAVIGAGISGLTIANLLKDKYIVKVYEKESIPGGLISCKEINGGLFHTCGGHDCANVYKRLRSCFTRLDHSPAIRGLYQKQPCHRAGSRAKL